MADIQPIKKEIFRLIIEPGLWRDYTSFSAPGIVQSTWFRWYHGRLRKIGGWQYIAGLSSISTNSSFTANDSPYGNYFTEPSYPSKQYSNQDITTPWEANFLNLDGTPYTQYSFITDPRATYNDGAGLSNIGYGIPRKLLVVVLDSIDVIIATADYSEPLLTSPPLTSYGGIAFANIVSADQSSSFVNGKFPIGVGINYQYVPDEIYIWSLDFINLTTGFESAATATYIVTHPSCASGSISDSTNHYVWIIPATDLIEGASMIPLSATVPAGTPSELTCNTEVSVSGGVCAVGPFLFAYGNNGLIRNSEANNPFYWSDPASPDWQALPGLTNDVNVCNSKIVKGISYQGTGATYGALFWSLDSLIVATFIGAPSVFSYKVVATNIGILGQNTVVEDHGTFYWLGNGRFFVFDGQVHEIVNNQNRNWFFENINYAVTNKSWGVLNPKYSEIWWFVPMYNSSECNWAIIYNHELQCWYDTPLSRSAGAYSGVFSAPLWFNNVINPANSQYEMYMQEIGSDAVDQNGNATSIPAQFITGDIGFLSNPSNGSPKSQGGWYQNWTELIRCEPDAVMTGDWDFLVQTRKYANSEIVTSIPMLFNSDTEKLDMRIQGRLMQIIVNSDTVGCAYYNGDWMLTTNVGDCEGI